MADDAALPAHRPEHVHALLLRLHRAARIRDGPSATAWDRAALGEAAAVCEESAADGSALVGGAAHDEGVGDEVQEVWGDEA